MARLALSELIAESGVQFGTSGARGLVAQMSDRVCYAYAAAFWQVAGEGNQIVLGHDLRPSSPQIAAACVAALRASGVEVVYAGALPTPALAFFASTLHAPAIVVTGSHIPFDRNGIKFYRAEGEITKADEEAIQHAVVEIPDEIIASPLAAPDPRPLQAYVARYLDFFGAAALAGMRVAVYEHSSVARDVLHGILEGLGAEVLSLGRADDFVPIDTEAVRAEDIAQARQWANEHAFDAILSTDGDADRPLIGDENGNWFRGDAVGILCAKFLGMDVVVTPVSSNTAAEKSGWFRKVHRTRIGSPYVIAGMQAEMSAGTVAGYEANGGFLLGSDVLRNGRRLAALPTRDAVLPMLAMLCMARERGCRLSGLSAVLPQRFTHSSRLQNIPPETSRDLIAGLGKDAGRMRAVMGADAGEVAGVDTTDGLRVTFAGGDIVHLRPSGNAPELRCYAESDTEARAQLLCDNCLGRIASL